jgi:hypothetical protein
MKKNMELRNDMDRMKDNNECLYSLKEIRKDLEEKNSTKKHFQKLYEKYENADKLDIIYDLAKKRLIHLFMR